MTDPDFTAIAILMDRSGSMESIKNDAEGALQAFIDAQRLLPGRCTVHLADFDTVYRTVYASIPIADAPRYHLEPRGGTALLDAIGQLVTEFGATLAGFPEGSRPSRVIVVVQTDGEENSSREWSREKICALITDQEKTYGWDFVFLGANQDAIKAGAQMGFRQGSSLTYSANAAGNTAMADSLNTYASTVRSAPVGTRVAFTEDDRKNADAP